MLTATADPLTLVLRVRALRSTASRSLERTQRRECQEAKALLIWHVCTEKQKLKKGLSKVAYERSILNNDRKVAMSQIISKN